MRVAIRADASELIGLGHLMRCLALGSALRTLGADVHLVTRDLGVNTVPIAAGTGVVVRRLPPVRGTAVALDDSVAYASWAAVGWGEDADQCITEMEHWCPHWVIVDHYSFDSRWHKRVRNALTARIAVIDDMADRELTAEVLIDTNLSEDHRKKYRDRISISTKLLCGPRFALLGPSYVDAKLVQIREEVRSIGIFMGGVDAMNLTSLALRACRDICKFPGTLEVVVTSASPHANDIEALARQWPDTVVTRNLPDLADFFTRHDLQIGAGGVAAWERCRVGVPTIAIRAAANQDAVLPALAQKGAVALVDTRGAPNLIALGGAVSELISDFPRRVSLSERSCALVDGLGATRVALSLLAEQLTVRRAILSDSEMMYNWRNNPSTRRMSIDPREIEWSEHEKWLHESIMSTKRFLLVGGIGECKVGIIRFDSCAVGRYEVSLYLDPMLYGLGLGRALLLAGETYILAHDDTLQVLHAIVFAHNEGSMRLFASCGYQLASDGVWRKSATTAARKGE